MYLYTLISHITTVLKKRLGLFIIALVLFLGLYSFFFALFTIPLPNGVFGFYRMTPPTQFDYFYMAFSSLLSATIITLTFHKIQLKVPHETKKEEMKGKISSLLGIATGIFGAVCPACLGINLLLFGNVFTAQLSFLIPYIFWVQLGGIAFLFLGLYFVAKSSYERKCISCNIKMTKGTSVKGKVAAPNKLFVKVLIGASVLLLVFQVSFILTGKTLNMGKGTNSSTANKGESTVDQAMKKAIEEVTPSKGFTTKVKWNDVVAKMVKEKVLDPARLERVLKSKYGQEMKPEWRAVLAGKNANLKINSDNAVFMMYVLWTLAKANNNQILFTSPFAKYFKNYNIGIGKAGYGNVNLLRLTKEQQKKAKEVAENASRPCCNNTTAQPDCSHGFSALGLVELMAAQNFSKQEMFATFVKFNSFWFPKTYVKNALYFKLAKGKDWSQVNKELVAGKGYSSLSGSYKVKNYLKEKFGIN